MNRHPLFFAASLALAVTASAVSAAEPLPAPVQALEKQGLRIAGPFKSASGLKAYAGVANGNPVALYVTPDGKFVMAGTLLNERGEDLDSEAISSTVSKPLGAAEWKQLEDSTWIADGKLSAPRVVYIFTDPNCPYCSKLWADARPWVESGSVQLRHVIVGILTPTSRAKAAALLADKNPSEAFMAYEGLHAPETVKSLSGGGRPRPLGDAGLKPLENIPPAIASRLDSNVKLMSTFGLQATPGVVWKDAAGNVQKRAGAPDSVLPQIFGPK